MPGAKRVIAVVEEKRPWPHHGRSGVNTGMHTEVGTVKCERARSGVNKKGLGEGLRMGQLGTRWERRGGNAEV